MAGAYKMAHKNAANCPPNSFGQFAAFLVFHSFWGGLIDWSTILGIHLMFMRKYIKYYEFLIFYYCIYRFFSISYAKK